MKTNVCKWGGSSLSDGEKVKAVIKYIKDSGIEVVVLSAPGKRYAGDTKVTDLLIEIKNDINLLDKNFEIISSRYREIINKLNITFDIDKHIKNIKKEYLITNDSSYLLSRGEWLISRIVAKALSYTFVDSKAVIKFDKSGRLLPSTYKKISDIVKKHKRVVFPGFYGGYGNKVKIFSRGGSDITGAIVSRALNINYTNFTDVDGIYDTFPISQKSKLLKKISYSDMKFLGMFGFGVLHHKVSDVLSVTSLKTTLKSTFKPKNRGTAVVSTQVPITASSKTTCLIAQSIGDIYTLLKNEKIFINLAYKYLDEYFYVIPLASKSDLDKLNIAYKKVDVTAIVSKKKVKNALPLGENRYLKIDVI